MDTKGKDSYYNLQVTQISNLVPIDRIHTNMGQDYETILCLFSFV